MGVPLKVCGISHFKGGTSKFTCHSVYHSLSPPAATGGLEQLYLNMIDLNV